MWELIWEKALILLCGLAGMTAIILTGTAVLWWLLNRGSWDGERETWYTNLDEENKR